MKSGIWLTDQFIRRYPNANEEEFWGRGKEYFYNPRSFIILGRFGGILKMLSLKPRGKGLDTLNTIQRHF